MKRIIYLDTSAALRVLFDEPGQRAPLKKGAAVATSKLSLVEAARAIERLRLASQLSDHGTVMAHRQAVALFSRCHMVRTISMHSCQKEDRTF